MNQMYMSPKECAEVLGVCPLTVYKMLADGRLEAIRVRRSVRIPVAALERLPKYKRDHKDRGSRDHTA
jgi:excisionase family DNA binding protein